jgi:pimeloyl-ACP methyl ester carboxylesterase
MRLSGFLVFLVWLPALVVAEDLPDREINAALSSPDSFLRCNTWKKLNPEKDSHYKFLVQILKTLSWYDRDGAVEALSKAGTEETIQKMVKDLKDTSKDPAVRQGMARALAKMNDEKFYPHLYEALKDPKPQVRRMVVWSLRVQKKKEAVGALVDAFQAEKDPVVQSFMIDALNSLTQAFQGPNPAAWKSWWDKAKEDPDYTLGKTDEESIKKAEELGNKLKKRMVTSAAGGVTLEVEERGGMKGIAAPILIIPYYGYSKEIMKPFLAQLERTNKLFYIDLPPVDSFQGLKAAGNTKIPYYPIDKLVEAFEDLRKATKQERFAIMVCGINSWIAMKYASMYPKSVSHLVFICPNSSERAYGDALKTMETQGKARNDIELVHFALTQTFNIQTGQTSHDILHTEKKIPVPDGEGGSLDRRSWSLFFKDERDSLISILYPVKNKHLGGVAIPDFRCFSEKPKAAIPTLVIVGKSCLYASVEDCQQIAKHFGGQCLVYENSSAMPFAEESPRFNVDMAKFLRERERKKTK